MKAIRTGALAVIVVALFVGCVFNPGREIVVQDQYPVDAGDRLTVTGEVGSIEVTAWDRSYMDVTARIQETRGLFGGTDIESVEIVVDTSGDITIWALPDDMRNVSVSYEIALPSGVVVERVRTETGSVVLKGVAVEGTIQTTTGSISLESVRGLPDLQTETGSITTTGPVRSARTNTGSIDVEFATIPALSRIPLSADTGSITLRLARGLDANIEAATSTGSITIDGSLGFSGSVGEDSARGTIGKGGPTLDVQTDTGSISLKAL
jgi:hypothetical protein